MRVNRIITIPPVLTLLLLMLVSVKNASASFIFTVAQVGASTVITGSGTLNTSALSFDYNNSFSAVVYPALGTLSVGTDPEGYSDYSGISGPAQLGPGGSPLLPTTDSGDYVGVAGGVGGLVVPHGYVSGSQLSDTDTYFDETIAQLGLAPGIYNYTWGSGPTADSLTIDIGVVPEPASAAAVAVPATFAFLRRRRHILL